MRKFIHLIIFIFTLNACDDTSLEYPREEDPRTMLLRDADPYIDEPTLIQAGTEMMAGAEPSNAAMAGEPDLMIAGMQNQERDMAVAVDDAMIPQDRPVGIRYVRILTTDSPSWVAWSEIQVIGREVTESSGSRNLSLGATAHASSTEMGSNPSYAIDGDEQSSWNAGYFPEQWIEIDLQRPCFIDQVRIQILQNPPGDTRHQIFFAGEGEVMRLVHTFSGMTSARQWLEYQHEEPDDPSPMPLPPSDLPRGLAWVKRNPMFISGLSVSVPPPSREQVFEYYDDFSANAVHLWSNGLPHQMNAWREAHHPQFRWVSWLEKDGTSLDGHQLAGGVPPNSPGRIGYQIGDEPGLNMDGMTELREIEVGINAVRALDPEALIFVNFSWWADSLDEMMEYYGRQMDGDVISYDLYSLRQSTYKRLEYFRAAGLRWQKPYWRYIFSYQDVGADNWPSLTDLRWDAFLGLVYGYTGHSWFVYQANAPHLVASAFYNAQGGLDISQSERWAMAAQINREMKNLGRAITQLTSTEVCYIPGDALFGLLQPEGTRDWTRGAGGDSYIMGFTATSASISPQDLLVGFFVDEEGDHYAMLQNPNHQGGEYQVGRIDAATYTIDFDFSRAPAGTARDHILVLDRRTGQVQTMQLISTGPQMAKVEVSLTAGDVWLFKYDTGRDFALGL